ncbi:GEVED domain-containing protein [Agarilytica rhodophyticola]|uniref:GEVED domain-containing protein n=1 Tax=Agarilytica rhodophyticola TaxID=1737490 RepID=UPI000B345D62|nr:GEVED domain-containing protein [Agarilytica rhodophyticola]
MKMQSFNYIASVAAVSVISLSSSFANAFSDYCDSSSQSSNVEWIESIAINGKEFASGNNDGYIRHPEIVAMLAPGTNEITLTPGFPFNVAFSETWTGWIDLNGDDLFTDYEKIFEFRATTPETVSFEIPEDLDIGLATLRVVMSYDGYNQPCGEYVYGETEDMAVSVDPLLFLD